MILCCLFSSAVLLGSIVCVETRNKGGSPHHSPGHAGKGAGMSDHPNTGHRRPFYIIAHMVNSLEEVDEYLSKGANAIESNIEFDNNGTVLGTFHGTPCDCFRTCMKKEKIDDFLEFIRDVTSFPDSEHRGKVTLLFLDLRTAKLPNKAKVRAGINIARSLVEYLWSDVPQKDRVNVLLSIHSVKERDVIRGAIAYIMQKASPSLLDKIGFDVGTNEPLDKIRQMYKRLGIRQHRWQGDGLSNCVRFIMPVERLLKAVRLRNARNGFVDKVYHWTIDFPYYITKSIRHGVDGIITNRPENVRMVVESDQFRNTLKVADINDNPWANFILGPGEMEEDRDTNPEILGAE